MRMYRQSTYTKGRVLLFSGGVDSAGCLSLLNEDDNVDLLLPLQHKSKAETWNMIPKQCRQYVVSCWSMLLNGGDKACGKCGKCLERIESGIPLEPGTEDAIV